MLMTPLEFCRVQGLGWVLAVWGISSRMQKPYLVLSVATRCRDRPPSRDSRSQRPSSFLQGNIRLVALAAEARQWERRVGHLQMVCAPLHSTEGRWQGEDLKCGR